MADGKAILAVAVLCALLMIVGWFALFTFVSPAGHFVVELFAVLVGAVVAYVSLRSFAKTGSSRILLVGSAFFLMAVLDLLHALSFNGMPQTILPAGTNSQLQFWMSSRVLGGLVLLTAVALQDRVVNAKRRSWLAALFFGLPLLLALVLSAAVWLMPALLPVYYVDGAGLTPLKVGLEYLAMALYAAAALLFFRGYRKRGSGLAYWFALGLVILVFSELCFTLYRDPWGPFVWLGHLYKVAAFAAFLVGLRQVAK